MLRNKLSRGLSDLIRHLPVTQQSDHRGCEFSTPLASHIFLQRIEPTDG
jgi:hypothetical protein